MIESSPAITIPAQDQLLGEIRPPGDKSISHRAFILSALTTGTSEITGCSHGHDVAATAQIVTQLGARVQWDGQDRATIQGDPSLLHAADAPLDCENSGTTMRLMMGVVASIPGRHTLVGDASLSRRPMDRVAIPLSEMGARCLGSTEATRPPVTVIGGSLHGISFSPPMASSQVKSAVLLAGLRATGPTVVHESIATRPHTEEMVAAAGGDLEVRTDETGTTITIRPSDLDTQRWSVPADPSQAAFFVVGGLLARRGAVVCSDLYPGPTRCGYLGVLRRMGAELIEEIDDQDHLTVRASSSELTGTRIDAAEIPSLDEVPILAVAAAGADGVTVFHDVGELRHKESDRLEATRVLVSSLGAHASIEDDTLIIEGKGSAAAFLPCSISAQGDHRMAMAAAIAGTVGNGATIRGFATVGSSYPTFLADLESL